MENVSWLIDLLFDTTADLDLLFDTTADLDLLFDTTADLDLLFDTTADLGLRDDAAMDLHLSDDPAVLAALIAFATDTTQDEILLSSCGTSIGFILGRTGQSPSLIATLAPIAQQECRGILQGRELGVW
jgi:hypothetical protein